MHFFEPRRSVRRFVRLLLDFRFDLMCALFCGLELLAKLDACNSRNVGRFQERPERKQEKNSEQPKRVGVN